MRWLAIACALGVALCWGLYGPTLSNARSPNREWGPFKPYVFIGVAYLVIWRSSAACDDDEESRSTTTSITAASTFPAMKWGFPGRMPWRARCPGTHVLR